MPNTFAYLMLGLWPVITLVMFRYWPKERAFIWSLLGAYLFLPPPPTAFDVPLMPPLTKESLPSLATLLICMYRYDGFHNLLPASLTGRILVAVFILSPIATILTNGEPVVFGIVWLPPLGLKDMAALVVLQFVLVLPMLMARHMLATWKGQRELLVALCIGGLIYSVPMLLEVRLAPQVNVWVYGFFQHSFEQMVRYGGFRPIVFLYHGLSVAFFGMTVLCAALALARASDNARQRVLFLAAGCYLAVVVVLCKSMGALLFAIFLVPVLLFLSRRTQIRAAALIALLAVSYPVLKGAELVPADWMLQQVEEIDAERAYSLEFRFANEELLMERAMQKPMFGWGSWGRNHVMNPESGAIMTIADGRWIIVIGSLGWVGYLAEFGLLALPILLLWLKVGRLRPEQQSPYIAPMMLLLAINLVEMIPNSTLTPITWLFAGALLGFAESPRALLGRKERSPQVAWQSIM